MKPTLLALAIVVAAGLLFAPAFVYVPPATLAGSGPRQPF